MNHLFFRTLPRKVLSMLAVTVLASSAALAAFPDKPIRVVIGFPAGGPLDQHARLLTERLQAVLGHSRSFIETKTYFGPDRRQRQHDAIRGRRRDDATADATAEEIWL